MEYRIEKDSMGEVSVPTEALYGAQTQRAVDNFRFSDRRMPAGFIRCLALIKAAAATSNGVLGQLSETTVEAIAKSAMRIVAGEFPDQFPVDVFQTGSATSTNMNMNEVIGKLAGAHPNDDVNRSQSSNDVIPTCIQVSATVALVEDLLPALALFESRVSARAVELDRIVKTGRTHLMDAMPLTFGQEFSAFVFQIRECRDRIDDLMPRLTALPIGGTAVGTGVNCPPGFPEQVIAEISRLTGIAFTPAENRFTRIAGQDIALECSSTLKSLAVVLVKIANDIRWMSSGPLAGLAEISLKPLQPGSSIMPGKVNPVIPEAVAMIGAEVVGNDTTISIAAQSGNFQLNVMLPLIAEKLLTGIGLMARATEAMAQTISDLTVNEAVVERSLNLNPILVTALNDRLGYEAAAAIAKKAYASKRPIIDVAIEETKLSRSELEELLDPRRLANPES